MWSLIALFVGVIIASGICSMTEAAVLSLPVFRARMLLEERRRNAETLLRIKENIHTTIAVIVVCNNAINIVGSIFVGQGITLLYGNQWLGLASTVVTFTIIVMAEIIPKTIGERYKIRISLVTAKPLWVLVCMMRPLVNFILLLTGPFGGRFKSPKITEEEIKIMLKLGRDAGTVEMDEEALCNRVFKLNDTRAFQMMKPIDQIYALSANKTLAEAKEEIIHSQYSRIAVYDKDPKDFVGTVQHRALLREIAKDNYEACVKDYMDKPVFVSHMTKADALLEKFQAYHQHLFIVQDEKGSDIGLITMEDVLEELFGEIYDEKDVKAKAIL
ncbi:MAG: hemolysin family protein [Candidatus Omnitrophota bacterium]